MTWSEFNTAVRVLLPAHNRRHGIQTLIDTLIKAAVHDLQNAIAPLRNNHRSTYVAARFVPDGLCGRASYPAGCVLRSVLVRDPSNHSKIFEPRVVFSEQERQAMVNGAIRQGDRVMHHDPASHTIRISPNPRTEGSEVIVVYDGEKVDFESDDDVPFDDNVVNAAADFVLARLSRMVDGDIQSAESYNRTYVAQKRQLYSRAQASAKTP